MVRMKPRIDRDHVLREEARRRAVTHCVATIPTLLHPDEVLGAPVREGDRIVIPVRRTRVGAAAVRAAQVLA